MAHHIILDFLSVDSLDYFPTLSTVAPFVFPSPFTGLKPFYIAKIPLHLTILQPPPYEQTKGTFKDVQTLKLPPKSFKKDSVFVPFVH